MTYAFNGKNISIDDKVIDTYMKSLSLSKDEAIKLYLEDNDYLVNEEVERLTSLAKKNGTSKVKTSRDKKVEVEKVPKQGAKSTPQKENIINLLANTLASNGIENITIPNKGKIIEFTLEGQSYKIDLIQKRQPKQ